MAKDILTETILSNSESPEDRALKEKRREERRIKREKNLKKQEASARRRKALRTALFGSILVLLLVAAIFFNLFREIRTLRKARADAQASLDALKNRVVELEETLENVTSPEYIESQARSLLKMIYPNEILYLVKDEE